MALAKNTTCETICLTALRNGYFEYFNINSIQDLQEAYKDFDNRIAHDTDIELQYIDGVLNGQSCYDFEEVMELAEDTNTSLETVRDIYNTTLNLNDTRSILENENYMYIQGGSKEEAFINYLEDISFFESVPEHLESYLDYKKIMRDYEYNGLWINEINFTDFLFIY
ncbi:MAG: hypothetical protein ACRCX2_15160 [Paraclostridium sp.]